MKTKTNKTDLERKKSMFFQLGLVVALTMVLLAFEWPSNGDINLDFATGITIDFDEEMIPITRPEDVTPPPPPVIAPPEIINIVDDEVEIKDEDIFKDINDETFKDLLKYPIIFDDEKELDETIPFMLIEEQPTFIGGDHRNFTKWVFANLKYPEIAAQNGIQGRVTLEFTIDIDGSVTNVRVIKGIDPSLDAEALRVVSNSPKWSPGLQRGKPTKVSFTFPITFRLN